jgi:predicted Zn-dependent protease
MRTLTLTLGAALILGGCATGNMSAYESGLEGAEKDTAGTPARTADIGNYRVTDLKPGHRPPLNTDEGGLWMKMDKAEGGLRSSGNIITDRALNAYVRRVTCRVAGKYCNDIRIYLARVPHFNATMAPNGAMQIWSGLLLRVQNEAQLAAVIGHEIAHYLRQHSLKRMRSTIETANSLAFFNMATLGITVGLADLAAAGSLQANNRDFEREADGYGLVLMAKAGYDPLEAPKVWQNLIHEHRAEKGEESSAFFLSTHPAKRERVTALRSLSKKAKQRWSKARAIGRRSYLKRIRPYRTRLLRDELQLQRFKRTQALIDLLKKDRTGMSELHYFQGELYRLRNKNGDRKLALASYQKALRTGRPPVELHRAMGLLLLKEKQQAKANQAFDRYLRRAPNAEDADMIRHMMKRG